MSFVFSDIHSLTLNNKSLAQTVQKEKENTALQLKERLNTESAYFELHKEYSLLKVTSNFSHSIYH